MSEPNELEWLGFELALQRYFIGRSAEATILARLVRRAGITCRNEWLIADTRINEDSLGVYVSNLRSSLKDLGFTATIENLRDCGYRLSEAHAMKIWQRVMTVVYRISEAA